MNVLLMSGDHQEMPGSFWRSWPDHPVPLVGLLLVALAYGVGWSRLRRAVGHPVVPTWRAWCFAGGFAALAVALLSPVAVFSERLFFMHMIQHLLLLLIAPPLLWLGAPLVPVLWGLPTSIRRSAGQFLTPRGVLGRVGHGLTIPGVAVVLYVGSVAIWHVPALYDAAQGRTITHDLQHVMFFGTALLYWWPIIHPSGGRRRLSFGRAIPYLLPPFLEGMLIGALITFADRPLYRTYSGLEPTWGLSVLDDQELGGLIMWVPGGMLFLIPLIGLIVALLHHEERGQTQRPAHG